ncbi:mechanosensitive ion channel family protein [Halioxenophilus sp. WMMB6]|uniref:mechanosensitive ion channel family protein n=1 Tax=Halioxenophilus sp. WMMB6 TaxID=3073815 RepID=UPI00295F539F|nr:mechanosensitive ion channel family protein [Halioxenophilus sp. WMMB6]
MNWLEEFLENWMAQTFVITTLTFFLAFIVRRILRQLLKKAKITRNRWDDGIISALLVPVNLGVILIGLAFATEPYPEKDGTYLLEIVPLVRELGLIVLFAWFLVNFIRQAEAILVAADGGGQSVDETTAAAVSKLLRVSVIVSCGLIVMQSLGYSVSGVLAFGGIGGIAVGFAAKDLLSNFFGALMIHLDRPFKVGDWVRSPDKEIEGVVENIGWRLTIIRTFDKRPLYVPNAVFAQIAVENPSRMTNRRIYETIGVRYEDGDRLPAILTDIKTMLSEHDGIDHKLVQMVNFNKFASSSLDFFIYVLTKTTDWVTYHQVKQDVLFKIMAIIEQHGAEIAFPTSTLHLASMPESPFEKTKVDL